MKFKKKEKEKEGEKKWKIKDWNEIERWDSLRKRLQSVPEGRV